MTARTSAAIRDNLSRVRGEVEAALERGGRGPGEARVLVASKYYDVDQISALEPEPPDSLMVEVDVGGTRLLSRVGSERRLAIGQRVWLIVNLPSLRDGLPAPP